MSKNKSKSPELLNSLEVFKNKAGCIYTQNIAEKILPILKKNLLHGDYVELLIAHNNFIIGESAEELYEVCNKLIKKYTIK